MHNIKGIEFSLEEKRRNSKVQMEIRFRWEKKTVDIESIEFDKQLD